MRLKSIFTLLLVAYIFTPAMAQRHYDRRAPQRGGQTTYVVQSGGNSGISSIGIIYGIGAGITCPTIKFEGSGVDVSSNPGFKIGMMWGVDLGHVEIVPELWYSTFKMEFKNDAVGSLKGAELRNNSVDVPIIIGVDFIGPLKLQFGPTLSLMCNNELTTRDGSIYEFGRIKGSVGYAAGVSCCPTDGFFIDFRYMGRFSSSNDSYFDSSEPYNIRMYTLDVTAGFRF